MTEFKQDTEITPVIFRKFGPRRGGDVSAFFPAEIGTYEPHTCTCYAHVGQHGSADLHEMIRVSRPARPEEYADLKKELESAPYGYRLKVYSREQPAHRAARQDAARNLRRVG